MCPEIVILGPPSPGGWGGPGGFSGGVRGGVSGGVFGGVSGGFSGGPDPPGPGSETPNFLTPVFYACFVWENAFARGE